MDCDERITAARKTRFMDWLSRFKQAIPDQLEDWLSSFHNGSRCWFVGISYGDFNFAITYEFEDSPLTATKRILRIPKEGMCLNCDDKVKHEVATMDFVRKNTTIPLPQVHAWGLTDSNPLGLGPYVIMDFVEGIPLADLWNPDPKFEHDSKLYRPDIPVQDLRTVYRQLARFLLELSNHPFESIGSLAPPCDKDATNLGAPFSLRIQDMERDSGIKFRDRYNETFSKSSEYFQHVIDQNYDRLKTQPNSVDNVKDARNKFIIHKQIEAAMQELSNPDEDLQLFRLFCDDFRPGNIMVADAADLQIVAIIDWEWTYTVPYQLFATPPRFLSVSRLRDLNDKQLEAYSRLFDIFIEELEHEETLVSFQTMVINDVDIRDTRSKFQCDHVILNATPHLPGLGKQPLSSAMRKNWESGRFWFHEILQTRGIPPDCQPWHRLVKKYPHLEAIYTVDEAEVFAFVEKKMEDLKIYKSEMKRMKARARRQRNRAKKTMAKTEKN